MINTTTALAAGGTDASTRRDGTEKTEEGVFAMTLAKRFKDLTTRAEKIEASFQTLSGMYPKAAFRIDDSQRDPAAGAKPFETVSSNNEVVVNADVLENMTSDAFLAEQIQKLLDGFLAGGWEKNLVDSREFEGQVWKSMSIQAETVGYYESYRTQDGQTAVAVANLRMEFNYHVGQNLNMLLGVKSQSSENAGNSGLLAGNRRAASNMFSFGGSWQFSGFFSASAAQYFNASSLLGTTQSLAEASKSSGSLGMTGIQSLAAISIQLEMQIQRLDLASGLMGMFGLVDPLVLDLGGEGINLRAADDGVYFDMRGDGKPVKTSFIQGNNAFLYLDANGNEVVDDINELFGDSQGHANGFAKLMEYDTNGDGLIDEKDEIYSKLRLWRDLNGDGINQREESMTLAEAGIASINLGYSAGQFGDGKGNIIGEHSTFTRTDGSIGHMADVWLRTLS